VTSLSDSDLILGPEDCAVLDRLRAVALLFAAARTISSFSHSIDVCLRSGFDGVIRCFEVNTLAACLHIAKLLACHDLIDAVAAGGWSAEIILALNDRTAAAELPAGAPPRLTLLLQWLHDPQHTLSPASLETLTRAGWTLSGAALFPLVPDPISAHEALEGLVAAEAAGGLGPGPLGLLARQAAFDLCGTPSP